MELLYYVLSRMRITRGGEAQLFHSHKMHLLPVLGLFTNQNTYLPTLSYSLERFSYDLEMKTREQNRNNKRTEIERFDWCMKRIQTHLGFGWLSERAGKQTSCPKNFLEISLTSYCNTIGQSNNAFSILGFLWRENEEAMF